MDEPSGVPIEVASAEAMGQPGAPRTRLSERFRPGFPWGLAAGALLVVVIVALTVGVNQFLLLKRFGGVNRTAGPQNGRIVVSPVEAGKPWFSVSPTGSGTLQAWSSGSSGSGSDGSPGGTVGQIEVGTIGVVDGVTVRHSVQLYLTATTKVFIGSQAYSKGNSASVADALVNSQNGPGADVLSNRLLTVEFHKVGSAIVADEISAPLEAGTNPLQY